MIIPKNLFFLFPVLILLTMLHYSEIKFIAPDPPELKKIKSVFLK